MEQEDEEQEKHYPIIERSSSSSSLSSEHNSNNDDSPKLPQSEVSLEADNVHYNEEENENDDAITTAAPSLGLPIAFGKISLKKGNEKKCKPVDDTTHNDDGITSTLSDDKDTAGFILRTMIRPSEGKRFREKRDIKHSIEALNNSLTDKQSNTDSVDASLPPLFIPSSSKTSFEAHLRSVSALSLNPRASRLATGGHDSEVRLWDFNGMTSEPNSFRRFAPIGGYGVCSLSYSPTGSHLLCAVGDAICRLYDLDGKPIQETVKGDMYVRDLAQTKGHTHAINHCEWHPFDKEKFLTASSDATIRIFDITSKLYGVDQALPHFQILKAIDRRNLNIAGQCRVTAAQWAPVTAKHIVGGCSDGSLQLWNQKRVYGKPDKIIRNAHEPNLEVTSIHFFKDEIRFLSRSMDCTAKLWDIRKFKDPVFVCKDLPNVCPGLNICLNPDETLFITGISSETPEASIEVYNTNDGTKLTSLPISKTASAQQQRNNFAITRVAWSEPLQQIIAGGSDGYIHMLYDTKYSQRGALLFVNKPAVSKQHALQGFKAPIFTPDDLPVGFKQTRTGEIKKVRLRGTDYRAERNEKIAASPLPSEVRTSKPPIASTMLGQILGEKNPDPVEALRAYASKAEQEPIFVTKAYERTQPKPTLDYSMEDGDDEKLVGGVSKCPRCGLKLCQCGYMRVAQAIKGPDALKQRRIT